MSTSVWFRNRNVKLAHFSQKVQSYDLRWHSILEAIDEKLGLVKNRGQTIRELAGWMSHEEAEELRQSLKVFDAIHEGDWP